MKISVDGKDLFELTDIQKRVIKNDVPASIFEEDMLRRLKWVLINEKYGRCFEKLKLEWLPKLALRMKSIPTDADELAALILSQPDYKDRAQRDREKQQLNIESKT